MQRLDGAAGDSHCTYGAQPGLVAFFCGECGMADGIWSLAPIAPSGDIAPVKALTEPRAR
jgi:hypothetical protein